MNGASPIGRRDVKKLNSRFWSKVLVVNDADSCWLWKASSNNQGYGQFRIDGTMRLAHRVAFFLLFGRWPKNILRHSCDTPLCVRGSHLIEGTQKQNMVDAVERCQIARGERLPQTKLSPNQIRDIRALRTSDLSQSKIAKMFNVAQPTISKIWLGQRWAWL